MWSTGAAVPREDHYRPYLETIALDAGCDLSRLNGASVLNAHQQTDLAKVLGVVTAATVDGRQGTATIRFSDRPDVEPFWRDVVAGVVRHVSVSGPVQHWVESRQGAIRIRHAARWTPLEVSFVPIPADPWRHYEEPFHVHS